MCQNIWGRTKCKQDIVLINEINGLLKVYWKQRWVVV